MKKIATYLFISIIAGLIALASPAVSLTEGLVNTSTYAATPSVDNPSDTSTTDSANLDDEHATGEAAAHADGEDHGDDHEGGHAAFAMTFLWIAFLLMAAKLASVVERFGQPAVLGELVAGVIIGNLAIFGFDLFEPIKADTIIAFIAELGVVILLFQIGLESNIDKFKTNGISSFAVAIIGVVAPFVLGTYVIGPWFFPDLSTNAHLFLGASLTATSVGITARVFKDLGTLKSRESQIVLGAAVIDDILGLIILAVVTALATTGSVTVTSVGIIIIKAITFLVGSIVLGQLFAARVAKAFSKINAEVPMKFTVAISFGLLMAYVAAQIGLAPIIGAFAAGLILDPIHFRDFRTSEIVHDFKKLISDWKDIRNDKRERIVGVLQHHDHNHVEDLIESLGHFFVPIFFVFTGMSVDLETLLEPSVLTVGLVITVIAFVGKYISGFAAPKSTNRSVIGVGMVPRGEVGLIFASIGAGLGILTQDLFSVIIIMVILTTLATPPLLTHLLKKD